MDFTVLINLRFDGHFAMVINRKISASIVRVFASGAIEVILSGRNGGFPIKYGGRLAGAF